MMYDSQSSPNPPQFSDFYLQCKAFSLIFRLAAPDEPRMVHSLSALYKSAFRAIKSQVMKGVHFEIEV